jgi:hypothetical protein
MASLSSAPIATTLSRFTTLTGAAYNAPNAKRWWTNTPGWSYPYNTITSEPMDNYDDNWDYDPRDWLPECEYDEDGEPLEPEERHPSLTAEERNA